MCHVIPSLTVVALQYMCYHVLFLLAGGELCAVGMIHDDTGMYRHGMTIYNDTSKLILKGHSYYAYIRYNKICF